MSNEETVVLACPCCQGELQRPLGWFRQPYFTCPACGGGLAAGQFAPLVAELDAAFEASVALAPNTNAAHRIDSIQVDTGLLPIRWYRLAERLGSDPGLLPRRYGVTHAIFPPPMTERGRGVAGRATSGGRQVGVDARTGVAIVTPQAFDGGRVPGGTA